MVISSNSSSDLGKHCSGSFLCHTWYAARMSHCHNINEIPILKPFGILKRLLEQVQFFRCTEQLNFFFRKFIAAAAPCDAAQALHSFLSENIEDHALWKTIGSTGDLQHRAPMRGFSRLFQESRRQETRCVFCNPLSRALDKEEVLNLPQRLGTLNQKDLSIFKRVNCDK